MRSQALLNWMLERHSIYLKRQKGQSKPWTTDQILRRYKFTNVMRELDAVSVDLITVLQQNSLAPLDQTLFNIIVYRTFNLPGTYKAITGKTLWVKRWNPQLVTDKLDRLQESGSNLFTGAYMMNAIGSTGRPKHRMYVERLTEIWNDRKWLLQEILTSKSIEVAVDLLSTYKNIGRFVAYEFATDFTYTPILSDAVDLHTWANPGPGAQRGLNRVFGRSLKDRVKLDKAVKEMKLLLTTFDRKTGNIPWGRTLTMRDIEHSLCEFDKYERVRLGEGRPRSKYPGEGK